MAISVGILNLVLREYEGALALYPLVSDCIRNVKIRIINLSVQKGHAGLVKKFHVDKVGSITSQIALISCHFTKNQNKKVSSFEVKYLKK